MGNNYFCRGSKLILGGDLLLKGTIYNALNDDAALDVNEIRSTQGSNGLVTNPDYGLTEMRSRARYFSLVARYDF